jgi:flagella basal body P-ring formation protein FlgA
MIRPMIHALIALLILTPTTAGAIEPAKLASAQPSFGDRFLGERVARATLEPLTPDKDAKPALKPTVTVADDIVRIGDLIENAGAAADVAIFRAPDLGQVGSVPAGRVLEALRPHHFVGLDTRGIAEVVVTRSSRAITAKDIEARILRALAGQSGLPDAKNLAVSFDNEARTLNVEAAATGELRVARLAFEPRSGRFDVTFDLPGSAVARKLPLRYTGAIAETFEALVPVRQIAQGEVLTAGDLTPTRRPKHEFTGAVIAAEQAVGLASKRALRPGQVIKLTDVAKPELIARNETVTISYAVPGIVVSIRGQALEPGTLGAVINVLNVQSKKTIQATVTGPGHVSVGAPRLANAALPTTSTR